MWVAAAAKVGILKEPPSPASEMWSLRKLVKALSSGDTQIADDMARVGGERRETGMENSFRRHG
jgi:hypothetical protein